MQVFDEEIDKCIYELILSNARGGSKQRINSAVIHLEKAWALREVDKEMSIFRAITAEEEAATAIFLLLKEKCFENAKKLKQQDHNHKQALNPFINSIGKFSGKLSEMEGFPFKRNYHLAISGEGKDRKLQLAFQLGEKYAYPQPPLEFQLSVNGSVYHFEEEINEISGEETQEQVLKYIKQLANLRNQLLYATNEGAPTIEGDIEASLNNRKRVCIKLMRIYALIYPYKEKAIFVQQCINAFLKMMGAIELSSSYSKGA